MDDCWWLEDISNSLHPRTERRRGRMFVCTFVHLLTALNHNCRVVMLLLLLQQTILLLLRRLFCCFRRCISAKLIRIPFAWPNYPVTYLSLLSSLHSECSVCALLFFARTLLLLLRVERDVGATQNGEWRGVIIVIIVFVVAEL